ncbi:MAG: hypothetical protein JW768_14805 [Chitinispirillaceae bacterium]|nr:hypothetical protein [Chitinispirillaceae bacterium]
MKHNLPASVILLSLFMAAGICCSSSQRFSLTSEDCACLKTVPDSCLVDTLGIVGTIFPKNYSYTSHDSMQSTPVSTWTPTKRDVIRAERIFQRHAANQYACLDSNEKKYYRQYIGQGSGNVILIHGIRKSHDIHLCGCRSFWINIYENDCSTFDAEIDIISAYCTIEVKGEQ